MDQLKKFLRYFKPYKGTILTGILCILGSMAFGLFVPFMVGRAIDDLGRGITWNKIVYYPLVILGKKFLRYFKPYKGTILTGILCILGSMAFGLFVPFMVGRAIDDLGRGITWNKIVD